MICEAFDCTPLEAEKQDPRIVDAVLDYRASVQAKEIFNGPNKQEAFKTLKQNPYLMQVLAKMARAQRGLPLDGVSRKAMETEALDVAETYRNAEEEAES